jgi:hypothetical protein
MHPTWPSTADGLVTISFARRRPDAAGSRLIAALLSKAHLSLGRSWPATYVSNPRISQPISLAP